MISKVSETFYYYFRASSIITLVMVILILALNQYKVIVLSKMPLPYLDFVLWGYLIINAGIATPINYIKNKNNPLCPKCKTKLEISEEYHCSKCGKLKFEVDK